MNKISDITKEVLYYYNCEIEAEKRVLTLYQFYKNNINYIVLSNIISQLYTTKKIDSKLEKKIRNKITYQNRLSIDFLEEFKNISKLPEKTICFLINHYFFSLPKESIDDDLASLLLKKLYKPLNIDIIRKIQHEKHDKFFFYITEEGLRLFKTMDDNKFEMMWNNLYITLENEEEKNEIQDLILSLEDINKDDVNLEITRRLKELLNSQLDIKF